MPEYFRPPKNIKYHDLKINYKPLLPKDKNASILDLGCGYGRILSYLQKDGYINILGVDRDPDAINWVSKNITKKVEHVEDLESYLKNRHFFFDLVIAKDMIYYFPKDKTVFFLKLINQSLRPEGRIIIEVFNGAAFTGPFIAYKDYQIEWIPTEHSLLYLLSEGGFKDIQVSAQKYSAKTLRQSVFKLLGLIWKIILRFIYILERGLDEQNPKILTTRIIAVAKAKHD